MVCYAPLPTYQPHSRIEVMMKSLQFLIETRPLVSLSSTIFFYTRMPGDHLTWGWGRWLVWCLSIFGDFICLCFSSWCRRRYAIFDCDTTLRPYVSYTARVHLCLDIDLVFSNKTVTEMMAHRNIITLANIDLKLKLSCSAVQAHIK